MSPNEILSGSSRSLSPRERRKLSKLRFVLPAHTRDALGPAVQSAREPRSQAALTPRLSAQPGLMKGLLKANHPVHLGLLPNEGAPLVKDTHADALSQLLSARESDRHMPSRGLEPTETTKAREELEEEERLKNLKKCFHLDARTIQVEFEQIYRWKLNPDLEPSSLQKQKTSQAQKLERKLELANLPTRIRKTCVQGNMQRSVVDEKDESQDLCRAHEAEMSASLSYLNFVRKLCGLPEVTWNQSKRVLCEVICKTLLPRMMEDSRDPKQKHMGNGPANLAQAVAEIVNRNEPVSILHGEGSLLFGLEQSMGASHMCKLPRTKQAQDPSTAAGQIAQSVGYKTEFADPAPILPDLRHNNVLPPSMMRPMKVLWDLAPDAAPADMEKTQGNFGKGGKGFTSVVAGSRRIRCIPAHESKAASTFQAQIKASQYGLDAIWGDRRGALSFRRCLLSPSLTSFAAVRYDDTCVLWTGKDVVDIDDDDSTAWEAEEEELQSEPRNPGPSSQRFDAVCFPPPGLVPLQLVEGRKTPWTIMPNSLLFQPTSNTKVQVWRVEIERDEKQQPINAVRLEKVAVNGFAVDCSTKGEPFCVIYWPDLELVSAGAQLEVKLTGLCGDQQEITMFHELMSFRRKALDHALVKEAALLRSQYGSIPDVWLKSQEARNSVFKVTEAIKVIGALGFKAGAPAGNLPTSVNKAAAKVAGIAKKTAARQVAVSAPDPIEPVSHKSEDIVATSDELLIVVKCSGAAVMQCDLHIKRFAGETAELPRSAQVQRLGYENFLVRVKIPMPRQKFELRFFTSTQDEPRELVRQEFMYNISAATSCPLLLRSLEDKNLYKYGYSSVSSEAQLHGLSLLSPVKYRVPVGQCYFLVIVDVERALLAARKSLPEGLAVQAPKDEQTSLFSHRLLPVLSTEGGGVRAAEDFPQSPREVVQMQSVLREHLTPHTQDGYGEIHLDLLSHNGEHIQRLRERQDIPGLFEGLLTVTELDVSSQIQLNMRFPRIHAIDFSPRKVCRWLVCRADDHVPMYF